MRITEIFHSIQGESSYAGRLCTFVRLTGCPLRCTWCDTAYAFEGGTEMTVVEVVDAVRRHDCRLVEITGGEPLQQPEAFALLTALSEEGYHVLLETSGALDISPVDHRVTIILDVKCPGSGMTDRMDWQNLLRLRPTDEVKFVLKDRADYEWACDAVRRYTLTTRSAAILFSPVFGELEPRLLAEWMLADHIPARLQLQLHKLIWDPSMRGV